jgi:DNA-binding transcriptional MocR family regulator
MLEQKYIGGQSAVNIARSIEAAVSAGKIEAGEQVPTVRELAKRLGVSGATVAAAYRILHGRGVTIAEGRRGTRIRPSTPATPVPPPPPRGVRNLAGGNPDRELLPDLRRHLRALRVPRRGYGEELNDRQLVTMARRQFRDDGVPAKHIAIVSGALDGIERVLREQTRPGDRVLVEDPCFAGVLDLIAALALVPVPIAVDDEGMLPAALARALRSGAQAIIVTPRAQNPTGAAMTRSRARRLRAILSNRPELLLIEDDHAGRVAGAPYVTLVESSRARFAVLRSVSKPLGPDLRLALLAGDAQTVLALERRQTIGIRWVSHILQTLVAALLRDRVVQRQLAVAEKTYAARRQGFLRALAAHGINAHGKSGLNVWIPVADESAVIQSLFQAGWAVHAGESYRVASGPAIRVTIASLTPADAKRLARDVAASIAIRGRSLAA